MRRWCLILLPSLASAALPVKHMGCFHDLGNSRDFPTETQIDNEDMTTASCLKHCLRAKAGGAYKYMALQDGNQCFCGDKYGEHGPSDKCLKRCRGGATPGVDQDTCGGVFANQVYEITGGADDPKAALAGQARALRGREFEAVLLGCFADDGKSREFEDDHLIDTEDMTVAFCKKHCIEAGPLRYFAVQDGNQCFCSNSFSGKHGKSDKCTKDCRGGKTPDNAGGRCGGPFANQVYEIKVKVAGGTGVTASSLVSCGVAAPVLVSGLVLVFTGLGDHSFCTAVLMAGCGYDPAWVWVGALLSSCFTVVFSALLGNIVPDSQLLGQAGARWAAAGSLVFLGLVQVCRSFRTAGRDQDERREELKWAALELGFKSLSQVRPDGMTHDEEGPSVVWKAFTNCLYAGWGGVAQLAATALALSVDVRSVITGGLCAAVYTSSLAATCTHGSATVKNFMSLRMNLAAGMVLFFLAMHHILEIPFASN
eukprot:Hpha_TRINITY_DN15648_c0_g2::TRINITY_DN15648_c0_g2_i1::g.99692::m.99692